MTKKSISLCLLFAFVAAGLAGQSTTDKPAKQAKHPAKSGQPAAPAPKPAAPAQKPDAAAKKPAAQAKKPAAGGKANPAKPKPPKTQQTANQAQPAGYLVDICSLKTQTCVRTASAGGATVRLPMINLAQTFDEAQAGYSPCDGLLTDARATVDATKVQKDLGKIPSPFSVQPDGNLLFLYSDKAAAPDAAALRDLETTIGTVASSSAGFEMELAIAQASALGDVATALKATAPRTVRSPAITFASSSGMRPDSRITLALTLP
jgi:hypothetical protein